VYQSGRPYTDFTQKEYVFHPNSERMEATHQLNLAAVYDLEAKHFKGQLGLSLINVYNRKNSIRKKFYYSGDEQNSIITGNINSLDFTPVLFVNLKF